ncbi:MAG TPA: phosphotransferase, partial [Candidatus Angelobacter sp.]|nr:phosphotransferase [Candidatus Angelobacter sp.]
LPGRDYDLQDCYSSYLGFSLETVRQAFAFKYPEMPVAQDFIQFDYVPRALPHPIAALLEGKARFKMKTWECRTHGDLHTGNILVDSDQEQPWLIDFGRAGVGHWLRDLVALEASITFQHIPHKDPGDLFLFEAALIRPKEFADPIQYSRSDQPELSKAAEVIAELRRIAGAIDGSENALQSYYAALFYQTINYVRLHKLIKNPRRKNHVLLAAALLYEKLNLYEK